MTESSPPGAHVREKALGELTTWLSTLETNPDLSSMIEAVVADEETDVDRWFVRVRGEAKDVYSVWFEVGQRTLAYETFVMPAPEENHAAFYEQLLVRNDRFRDLAFSIGEERAIYLKGRVELAHVSAESLDRALGSIHAAVEQSFRPALQIGFASRFTVDESS